MINILEIINGLGQQTHSIDLSKEVPPDSGICQYEEVVGELSDELKKFFCALRNRTLKLDNESREVDALVVLVQNGGGTDAEKEIVRNHLLNHELVEIMKTLFGYEVRNKFPSITSDPHLRVGEDWKVIVCRKCEGCSLLEVDLLNFDVM